MLQGQVIVLDVHFGAASGAEEDAVRFRRGEQNGGSHLFSMAYKELQAEPVQNQPQLQSTVFRLPRDIPGVDDVESIAAAASVQTEKLLLGERGALSSARRLRYTGELRRLRVFLLTSVFPL